MNKKKRYSGLSTSFLARMQRKNEDMNKEKRTERKTLPLTPSEFAAFTAAANASGLPLTAWLVQAAREKLAGATMRRALQQIAQYSDPGDPMTAVIEMKSIACDALTAAESK